MLTAHSRRTHFPSLSTRSYLNTAAEGIPPAFVGETLEKYLAAKTAGMDGRESLFEEFAACRGSAAELFGLTAEEVSFCSSTSEAYNLLATAVPFKKGDNLIVTDLDFPSGATPWLRLSQSPEVRIWKNHEGVLRLEDLERLIDQKTKIVQVSLVSFLTGFRIDWASLRDLVRAGNPDALLAVDVTQAAGRVVLDCIDADCLFASSYKWLLGTHGGCVVAVPKNSREKIITQAGGWYHLANAFDEDRFVRAESFSGASGFAVGMPSFPAIYALRAGIDYLNTIGIHAIAEHADPLAIRFYEGLIELGIKPMSPIQEKNLSGIVAFQHEDDHAIDEALREQNIHIMCQAGRLRVSIHGYNDLDDIEMLLAALKPFS